MLQMHTRRWINLLVKDFNLPPSHWYSAALVQYATKKF